MGELFPFIEGGAVAAKGFQASGEHLGIRKNRAKRDTALIVSDVPCAVACCYTRNLVQGAPIAVTKANVANGHAQAIICNSGNANTCNANGEEIARGMCELVEKHTGVPAGDVVVASTGVIGQEMTLDPFTAGMAKLAAALRPNGGLDAAEAIMTTDTVAKEVAVEFPLNGKTCRVGGISKGSGMIHPNMATMLCFLTTDTAITPACLQSALDGVVKDTFNMLSIDGDTSTNDMVTVLANGLAGNGEITGPGADYETFRAALLKVCARLCRMMAKDGEGATKLLTCTVTGAKDAPTAKLVAKSVICSTLLKAAIFGSDANWGRVLCAIGYSGADVDVAKIDVQFVSRAGIIPVCTAGSGVQFDEGAAKKVLSEDEIDVAVQLNSGKESAIAWGCDLTYDYVKINGDYRT
ncbi:MAG TPA: bifunctional glutamate N-acetyltransferase/amino-acid acetyltransferase ArgJ [Candidatus Limiplasma sp.]|nr:bifunctional glutamate N-acetyltransferase/amino-acid acetyltransferase ArgJ [Candidatus Limiplasma sp.]HPS81318.1 bifunctional glutamate N-acetyltransferase/amino-acid acetyltransferase ArgJ [Candidatus Limiplasma sp.]